MNWYIEEPEKLLEEVWRDQDVVLTLVRCTSLKNSIRGEKMDSASSMYHSSATAKMRTKNTSNPPFTDKILGGVIP